VKLSESKILSYSEDIRRKLVKLKAQQKEEDRTHKLDREKLKVHQNYQTVSTPIYLECTFKSTVPLLPSQLKEATGCICMS
jgi:hypothetical protein